MTSIHASAKTSILAGTVPSGADLRDAVLDYVLRSDYEAATFSSIDVDLTPSLPSATFNQGADPICISHSVAILMMWLLHIPNLSSIFVYQLRADCTSNVGMSFRDALSILHKYGIPLESEYPNTTPVYVNKSNPNPETRLPADIMSKAAKNKLPAYGTLYSLATALDLLDLAGAYQAKALSSGTSVGTVACVGPIVVVIPIYVASLEEKYPWRPAYSGQQIIGYHGVQLVGYNVTAQTLLLRNEWSSIPIQNQLQMPFSDWSYVVERWFGTNDSIFIQYLLGYMANRESNVAYNPTVTTDGYLDNNEVQAATTINITPDKSSPSSESDSSSSPSNSNSTATTNSVTSTNTISSSANPLEVIAGVISSILHFLTGR